MIDSQPLTPRQINQLFADLHPSRVSTKQGMSYLEAHDVKATLIRIFGFANFSADLIESQILDIRQVPQSKDANKMNEKVTAKAVVRLTIHQTGATYTEAAVAGSSQPDITESIDMATKSAESDALKRAAIYLGTQFGLSLYQSLPKGLSPQDDLRRRVQDQVRVTMAPDQQTREQAQAEIERLNRIVEGFPADPPQQAPQQAPVRQDGPSEGVTPEQHQENLGLVDRALNMKREREGKATGPAEGGSMDAAE